MLGFLKRLFSRKPSIDPVALVSLETTLRVLSTGHVAQAISRALGRPFPEAEVKEERLSYHRVTVEGYELTVISTPRPYIPKKGEPHPDLRLRDAIERHEAAVMIDCWGAPEGHERTEATGLMGKILAELLDDSSLAVYCFHTQRLNIVDDTLVPMLREGRAMEAMESMTFGGINGVADDDERLQTAKEEARARWPDFAAAFAATGADDDRPFLLKAPFGEGERCEHMWVQVESISDDTATGVLLNDPLYNRGLKKGQQVTVPCATISDWAYPEGEGFAGMFTEAIVRGD